MDDELKKQRNREYVRKCRAKQSPEKKRYINARYTRSIERWISARAISCRHEDVAKGRGYDIDAKYVECLHNANKRCQLTNVELVCGHSLWSLSIDRIDNLIGHLKNNIQLVCRAINLAKNHHSNSDVINFIKCVVDPQLFKSTKWSRDYISSCVRNANRRDHANNINTNDVIDLYNKQNHRCAFTGIELACCAHPCFSLSIDRIDNSIGHLKSNIRLVVKAANRAKSTFSDIDFVAWLEDVKRNYKFGDNQ